MSTGGVLNMLENELQQRLYSQSSVITNSLSSMFVDLSLKMKGTPITLQNGNMAIQETETHKPDISMEQVRNQAELMAHFVVHSFGKENDRTPPNKYCKAMSRTVSEISSKHKMVFSGILKKLDTGNDEALQTFSFVADEVFEDKQVNWGRIVSLYAFAAHFAGHIESKVDESDQDIKDKFAIFVGQFVANKLGQWVVNQGGWDTFLECYPDPKEFEIKMWKFGLLTALGLGAMATVFGSR